MTPRADIGHLPAPIQRELHRAASILFETFAEAMRGRLSDQYRTGRIIALILHGPLAEHQCDPAPGDALHMLAIVNHPRLARSERNWRLVRDRLRRASLFGEIAHPVRLTVASLDRINRALGAGVPHFVTLIAGGIVLYRMEGLRFETPRPMSMSERRARGCAEFDRWYRRGNDFLSGAGFYRTQGNGPMAALLLHQACEHYYQSVLWSISLHGPRSHALDDLRERAEILDSRLHAAWPRETPFERRAFGCIRRAYVEARYGHGYRITPQELAWAMERVALLRQLVETICLERLSDCPEPMPEAFAQAAPCFIMQP
ncbi:HEPN domain-containing protein [Sphingobium sp. B2]|uniref:HEPN domain-containing protein n=1 Tax=Sphingobium sp. B2 TaxID=2583228 RepID=UPI0011A9BA6C|nr:HEPN domain-containing protein [Sphingobium sp. B2]